MKGRKGKRTASSRFISSIEARELTDDYGVNSRGFAVVSLFCPRIFRVFKETSQRERMVKVLTRKVVLAEWTFQAVTRRNCRLSYYRDFKIRQRDGDENVKEMGLEGKTTTLHVHHTFL